MKPSGNQQTVEMIQGADAAHREPDCALQHSAVRKDRVSLHPLQIVGHEQGQQDGKASQLNGCRYLSPGLHPVNSTLRGD